MLAVTASKLAGYTVVVALASTDKFFVGAHMISMSPSLNWHIANGGGTCCPSRSRASARAFMRSSNCPTVTPANPLLLVWDAVNRLTLAGEVLGPAQRISALGALRAVTSDAAWQICASRAPASRWR